jgi:hypothetical protein
MWQYRVARCRPHRLPAGDDPARDRAQWYRRRIRYLVLIVLVLAACSDDSIESLVKGSPSDLRTAPGTYDGYRVSHPCSGNSVDVGLEGLGAHPVTTDRDIAGVGSDIVASLADVSSVWGGAGQGLQCHSGIGTTVSLDDWRDVDRVLVRIGTLLRERDLSLQVGISVSDIPVAAEN